MKIGILKEIKNNENRVALPPAGVMSSFNRAMKSLLKKVPVKAPQSLMKLI